MAGGTGEPVPSGAMEATPALDPRVPVVGGAPATTRPVADASYQDREPDPESMSLSQRLRQPRTIFSIAVPIVIIAVFVYLNSAQLSKVPALILAANGWLGSAHTVGDTPQSTVLFGSRGSNLCVNARIVRRQPCALASAVVGA